MRIFGFGQPQSPNVRARFPMNAVISKTNARFWFIICSGKEFRSRNGTYRSGYFGLADLLTGLFDLGRYGLQTFRSDYEILQKSYMLTF